MVRFYSPYSQRPQGYVAEKTHSVMKEVAKPIRHFSVHPLSYLNHHGTFGRASVIFHLDICTGWQRETRYCASSILQFCVYTAVDPNS